MNTGNDSLAVPYTKMDNEECERIIDHYQNIFENLYAELCEMKQECERLRRENVLLRSRITERSFDEDYDC